MFVRQNSVHPASPCQRPPVVIPDEKQSLILHEYRGNHTKYSWLTDLNVSYLSAPES